VVRQIIPHKLIPAYFITSLHVSVGGGISNPGSFSNFLQFAVVNQGEENVTFPEVPHGEQDMSTFIGQFVNLAFLQPDSLRNPYGSFDFDQMSINSIVRLLRNPPRVNNAILITSF